MSNIVLFEDKNIRRVWYNEQWYFCITDIVSILTESISKKPTDYWRKLKQRLKQEGNESVTNCHTFKVLAPDNKNRLYDFANTETVLRIIQSIPSPKAEPFKLWLAKVGYERVKEIQNPELAMNRMKEIYEKKGYPKQWIDKRMRGIAVRQDLTDEWQKRGVKTNVEFAILTNEIMSYS